MAWRLAGEWDAENGLMPMPVWALPDGDSRLAYAHGYRAAGRLGVAPCPFRGWLRPEALLAAAASARARARELRRESDAVRAQARQAARESGRRRDVAAHCLAPSE